MATFGNWPRLLVGLWLLFFVVAPTSGQKPEIVFETDEIVVPSGGVLNLTCRGEEPVAWMAHGQKINFDRYEEIFEKGHQKPYVALLVMSNLNYTEVGYYMCFFNSSNRPNVDDIKPENDNVSSIYVYVKDTTNLLVKDLRLRYTVMDNETYTLPCKPTFPEVQVTLQKNWEDVTLENPREGFRIIPDTKDFHWVCVAEYGDHKMKRDILLDIKSKVQKIPRPTVDVIDYWQRNPLDTSREIYDVLDGSHFNLSCKVDKKPFMLLTWETPNVTNKTGNQVIYYYKSPHEKRVLYINAASHVDEGEYKCNASLHGDSQDHIVYINIVEKEDAYVRLYSGKPNVTEEALEEVSWLVIVHAYPKPDFIWRKEDTLLLETASGTFQIGSLYKSGRYSIDMQQFREGKIRLEIKTPTLLDVGEYTLEASVSGSDIKDVISLNFTMEAKPTVDAITYIPQKRIWLMKEDFKVTCEATGYPRPEVELQFKPCSSRTSCDGTFLTLNGTNGQRLNSIREDSAIVKRQHEVVKEKVDWIGLALSPGYFRCEASNDHGTSTGEELPFFVSDSKENETLSVDVKVNDNWMRTGANVTVVEGDNVTFTCLGNKMLTSDSLQWQVNGVSLAEGKGSELLRTVDKPPSSYSYITEVIMENARLQKDSIRLTCTESEYSVTKQITVKEMVSPTWNSSKPESAYDRQKKDNLTLTCRADGAPKPTVTWYKDEVELKESSIAGWIGEDSIHFSHLQTTDSGDYKCVVRNRAGSLTSETKLTVTDPNAPLLNEGIMVSVIAVAILVMVVIIIIFCIRIYKDKKRAYALRLEDHRMFVEGSPENLNPDIGLDQQADLLPYDTKYEVPRDAIIFDKVLGSGAFGRVYRATVIELCAGQPRTTVAVKMMKSRTDCAQLKALRSEVKIMIHIGRHVNIVNLLGVCSKDFASKGELLLLVEYCRHGNILDYMRRHRKDFVDQINDHDRIDPSITDNRMRQRSDSGSRMGLSRGLKYSHLSFSPDAVSYHVDQGSDGHSAQAIWTTSDQMAMRDSMHRQSFRARTMSASSNHQHVASDMSALTCETSNGGSEDYFISNGLQSTPKVQFFSKTLLLWAFQIAKGMEYLAFRKVLHGDLAARNILLAEDNIVKISDFGLAKDIYKNRNYCKKSDGPVPVKWLALECLRDGVFSTQSDIWAYGVVLWEIFSLGQNPYSGVEFDENFITKLEKGVRLEQPRYSTYDLYSVMNDCWAGNPLDRPSFSALETRLGEMIGEAEREYYLELNQPYQTDNTDSTFLSRLQSPDYSLKVREGSPTVDKDGYEVPFSPSPCGAVGLPFAVPQTPRHTTLQMNYLDNVPLGESPTGTYVAMSTPGHKDQVAFDFDDAAVKRITRRDSEAFQQDSDFFGNDDEETEVKYLAMETPPKPSTPGAEEEEERLLKPSVAMRPKVLRLASEAGKYDSGVYSPTTMQNNPSYVIMNSFLKTDDSNYLTRQDSCEDQKTEDPLYLNYNGFKKPLPREYLKEECADAEYANLLISEPRGRTVSEASSGVGSTELGRHIIREAIIEEPIAA